MMIDVSPIIIAPFFSLFSQLLTQFVCIHMLVLHTYTDTLILSNWDYIICGLLLGLSLQLLDLNHYLVYIISVQA